MLTVFSPMAASTTMQAVNASSDFMFEMVWACGCLRRTEYELPYCPGATQQLCVSVLLTWGLRFANLESKISLQHARN
ncbi:hypothetical protein D3C79_982080 [compost metagenome]